MRRLAAVALFVALTASCASRPPEYIEISPQCTVPSQPALPTIKREETAVLPASVYFRLEDRERKIVDWALEMRNMLREICGGKPGEGASDAG